MRCRMHVSAFILIVLLPSVAISQVTVGGVTVPKEKFIVYLFLGHSNMAGRGGATMGDEFLKEHPRAWNYKDGKAWAKAVPPIMGSDYGGPTIPFLKKMADKNPGYYIGSVHVSGSALTIYAPNYANNFCKPGGNSYNKLVTWTKAVQSKVTLGGIVCMLGYMESCKDDVNGDKYAKSFGSDFKTVVAALRKDLNDPDLPVLIGALEQNIKEAYYTTVKSQIESVASTNNAKVSSDNLNYKAADDHHYSPAGHVTWAGRAVDIVMGKHWFPVPTSVVGVRSPLQLNQVSRMTIAAVRLSTGHHVPSWSIVVRDNGNVFDMFGRTQTSLQR